jgi:ABC-type antimicrobial peptide transport system permease subunit
MRARVSSRKFDRIRNDKSASRLESSLPALNKHPGAAIGIDGLMAYSVQLRTQEIDIRLALDAERSSVRAMLINQGIGLLVIGAAVGLASAFGLTHLIASLLYGVRPRDPIVFLCVPVTLIVVAFLAVWFPARRATRINPVEALLTRQNGGLTAQRRSVRTTRR